MPDYQLLNSGNGRKLEQFGSILINRPSLQAVWKPVQPFLKSDATFTRDPDGKWDFSSNQAESWLVDVAGIKFKLSFTDFGHLGIFPEQRSLWQWIRDCVSREKREVRVLNLFAYSGGSTLAAAQGGARVTHLDASKKMVSWAKENAALNQLEGIRWIVDDVRKFLKREIKRGVRYDAIILDPPSFGRGAKGEVFKIEKDLNEVLESCQTLLSDQPLFFLLTCHSPGYTPIVLQHLLSQMFDGSIDCGEMLLEGKEKTLPIPSGCFARWCRVH